MQRFVVLTALACALSLPALAQTQAPAQPAKYIPPVKNTATIEVLQTPSKRVGQEMVTVIKVRNTSKGSINLLKADEYWYDRNTQIVSGSQYSHKKAPIKPGEIVEITLRAGQAGDAAQPDPLPACVRRGQSDGRQGHEVT
jgi:hypothetical protein